MKYRNICKCVTSADFMSPNQILFNCQKSGADVEKLKMSCSCLTSRETTIIIIVPLPAWRQDDCLIATDQLTGQAICLKF